MNIEKIIYSILGFLAILFGLFFVYAIGYICLEIAEKISLLSLF